MNWPLGPLMPMSFHFLSLLLQLRAPLAVPLVDGHETILCVKARVGATTCWRAISWSQRERCRQAWRGQCFPSPLAWVSRCFFHLLRISSFLLSCWPPSMQSIHGMSWSFPPSHHLFCARPLATPSLPCNGASWFCTQTYLVLLLETLSLRLSVVSSLFLVQLVSSHNHIGSYISRYACHCFSCSLLLASCSH